MTTQNLCVRDIMITDVISVTTDMPLRDAWLTLAEHRISGAPVVNESKKLCGVISQSDLLQAAIEDDVDDLPGGFYGDAPFMDMPRTKSLEEQFADMVVEDVCADTVITAGPEDSLSTLAVLMRRNHIHRVIITEDDSVVGIVTALDILGVLEDH